MMIIHIGLPKTATTYWQHTIFPEIPDIDYVHVRAGQPEPGTLKRLRGCLQKSTSPSLRRKKAVAVELAALKTASDEAGRPLLLSNENLSVTPQGFWSLTGPGPLRVARRLERICRGYGGIDDTIRIIIGVREQATWLAARYAQSSKARYAQIEPKPEFSQQNFEARVEEIATKKELADVERWLEYDRVAKAFSKYFGGENVLVMPMELLSSEPDIAMQRMQDFIGKGDLKAIRAMQEAKRAPDEKRVNSLATSESRWKMGEAELELPPKLAQKISDRFAASNAAIGLAAAPMPAPAE